MIEQPADRSRLAAVNDPERIRAQIAEWRAPSATGRPTAPPRRVDSAYDLVITGRRVLVSSAIAEREVGIRDGKIASIEPLGAGLRGVQTITLADDETLVPGLVDTHVHVNGPAVRTGRDLPQPPGLRPPAASPRSSTCPSTPSRQR